MSIEFYVTVGLFSAFGSLLVGTLVGNKYDNTGYFIVGAIIGMSILLICIVAIQTELNFQKEIYDKTVFQPWVKSLDAKSCEELGNVIIQQKLLENQTAINAGLKVFNQKECHFDISSGQALELLN